MKVSWDWLNELAEIKKPKAELVELINLRTIAIKEVTEDFIELDMKGYNRADLLSMRGVAYEIAAITDSKVKFTEPKDSEYIFAGQNLPKTPVKIVEDSLSPVQAVAKIEGLKVGPSPKEWVKKLNDSGMRSVNNIADVTNLVMLEYGHPLHAFDAKTVKDDTIIVRRAKDGEELMTLDGKLRKLSNEDIVLADREKTLDIAGIMGGKDTEIKDSTYTILLSASLFNPKMVRATAQKLRLSSEASKRFYHGLTKTRLLQALDAAIRMYQELGGKLIGLNIVGETEDKLKVVNLTKEKTDSLIGVEIPSEEIKDYLTKLHFSVISIRPAGEKSPDSKPADLSALLRDDNSRPKTDEAWQVTPPYWRLDIDIEEDLVEEVARMYGYERIPAKPLPGKAPAPIDQTLFKLIHDLKDNLVETGLTEVQTYSFYSTQVLNALGFDETNKKVLVKIANPMSVETEYMRMNLWPNLIEVIGKNIRQGFGDIAVFEIGKEYTLTREGGVTEGYSLAVALMNGTNNPLSEVNQILQDLSEKLNLDISVKEDTPPAVTSHLFHPKRFLSLYKGDLRVGGLAEIHPRVLDKMGISKRVAVLQIEISKLL